MIFRWSLPGHDNLTRAICTDTSIPHISLSDEQGTPDLKISGSWQQSGAVDPVMVCRPSESRYPQIPWLSKSDWWRSLNLSTWYHDPRPSRILKDTPGFSDAPPAQNGCVYSTGCWSMSVPIVHCTWVSGSWWAPKITWFHLHKIQIGQIELEK